MRPRTSRTAQQTGLIYTSKKEKNLFGYKSTISDFFVKPSATRAHPRGAFYDADSIKIKHGGIFKCRTARAEMTV